MTRLLAAALLICSWIEARRALSDMHVPTPNRIAGFGLSTSVWITLGLEVFLCVVFLLVPWIGSVAPSAVHFGSRRLSDYTEAQLDRVMPVVKRMMGALCVGVTFFMGLGTHLRIEQARHGTHAVAPMLMVNGAMVVCLLVITLVYGQQMDLAAEGG